jgi:hypothetical protein
MQQPTPIGGPSRENSNEWRNNTQTATLDIPQSIPEQLQSPPDNLPTKVQIKSPESGELSGWIEALGVDHGYQPPPERPVKPIASIFVQPRIAGQTPPDNFHRAVYLMKRTLKDFNNALATKCNIEPTQVLRTYRINRDGLHILFDDDCVREMPEGQDMTAEFSEIKADTPIKTKREWDAASTDMQCDGDVISAENVHSTGYELKLLF